MTGDYTDIDKLRDDELADAISLGDESWFWPVDGEKATVLDVLIDLQRSRAELVGLRTEVDQLRGENAELRENVVHMESERTGKCLACGEDWTCNGYYADIAHEARVENLITAERDALQAEVETLKTWQAKWLVAISEDPIFGRVVTENEELRAEVAALQARIDAATKRLRAALGVDPQKEERQ